MKVTPSNQTLILANERPSSRDRSGTTPDRSSSAASKGAVLQRVTIVAARPDTIVYVRADYSAAIDETAVPVATPDLARTALSRAIPREPENGDSSAMNGIAASPNRTLVALPKNSAGQRDSYGNLHAAHREASGTFYLTPAEQYARTQRIPGEVPRTAHIDVHA